MTKAELVASIATKAGITKTAAEKALHGVLDAIQEGLIQDGKVPLTGFGVLAVESRKERTGRNPRTGKPMKIAACKVVKFRTAKALKEAVR